MLLPQLVILSDGSAYTQLSTSPRGVVRSAKDVRSHPLWNPTLHKLMKVEEDEAGRLQAFRGRYGRGWDNAGTPGEKGQVGGEKEKKKKGKKKKGEEPEGKGKGEESLVDLLSGGFYQDFMKRDGGKKKKVAAPVEEVKDVKDVKEPAAAGKKK